MKETYIQNGIKITTDGKTMTINGYGFCCWYKTY